MTMNGSSVLLAVDFGDVLQFLVIAVIIGFSIISKLLRSNPDARAQKNQNRPRPAPRPGPPAAGRPQPQGIEQEIETFLRQARGGKHAAARRQPPPAPPRRPVVAEAVPVSEMTEPGHDFGRGVASHVKEHLDSKPIGESATHLAERIEVADENVERHLEEVFAHDVGRLAHAEKIDTSIAQGTDAIQWDQADKPDTTPHGIAEMLRSPGDIRKIFILSEILHRREI